MEKIEKIVIDENFTRKLLTRLDPLCLKDPHGHPIAFNTAYECYLLMMTKAKMFFPNGYIETSLFLSKLYNIDSWKNTVDVYEIIEASDVPDVVYLQGYQALPSELYFCTLSRALCQFLNTSYDDSAFRYAFKIFNENNNKLNKASDEEKNKNE
ncbi:MAG: hypothetical protein IKH01_09220 [Prevotella sp.]|nr:hypothetical protein [Prevotella sp.]